MSYNSLILKKINADQYLANILDNSVKETGRLALEQAHRIKDGLPASHGIHRASLIIIKMFVQH